MATREERHVWQIYGSDRLTRQSRRVVSSRVPSRQVKAVKVSQVVVRPGMLCPVKAVPERCVEAGHCALRQVKAVKVSCVEEKRVMLRCVKAVTSGRVVSSHGQSRLVMLRQSGQVESRQSG